MVGKIVKFLSREINGLHEAAYLLGFFTILSQVLGLVRDRLLAAKFGAGIELDIYYSAFRIPDFIFILVCSLVSVSVLIPIIVEKINRSKEECKKFIDGVFSLFLLLLIIVGGIAFVFIPQILNWFVPDLLNSLNGATLILMTRILLLSPLLLGFSGLIGSIVQAQRNFLAYALAPILYNAGIILGILYLYPKFGLPGLAWGVVIGALLHILIQVPHLISHKLVPSISSWLRWNEMKSVLSLSIPRTIALSASQLALIFLVGIASKFSEGSITVFSFAMNLQSVPMSIIGASYSLAAFPVLSKLFVDGHKEEFLSHILTAVKHIIFWSIPVSVLFIVLRAQIVRTILGAGSFNWADTRLTAACLAIFAVSVTAQSLVLLFVRAYYAAGKTIKPLAINTLSAFLTIAFAFIFSNIYIANESLRNFFGNLLKIEDLQDGAVTMIALAFSVGALLNALFVWFIFSFDFKGISSKIFKAAFQSLIASIVMGYVTYSMLNFLDDFLNINTLIGIFSQGLGAGLIGILVGVIVLKLLGNSEIEEVIKTLHKKIWKSASMAKIDPAV